MRVPRVTIVAKESLPFESPLRVEVDQCLMVLCAAVFFNCVLWMLHSADDAGFRA